MSDKIDLIYDLLKQDREEASEFRKEVRDSHKQTDNRLTALEIQGAAQNESLDTHIEGVKTLKKLHNINAARLDGHDEQIEALEKPSDERVALKVIKKWILGLGGVAAAVTTITKFLGLW